LGRRWRCGRLTRLLSLAPSLLSGPAPISLMAPTPITPLEWLHRQFGTHVSGTQKAARGKEDIDTVLVASSSWMESWEDGRGAGTGLRVERSARPRRSSLVANPHGARPQQPEHMGWRRREQQGHGSRSTRAATGALEGAATGALGDGGRDPAPELENGFARCRIDARVSPTRIFSGRYGARTLSLSIDLFRHRCCMLTGAHLV
jgi:hypothetical protein